jgi:hypothetical protein
MEIEIVFQTWDGESPVSLRLSAEDYFDPIGPDESYEADAIPKYNHTWEYLDVPREQLKWTSERRVGTSDDTVFFTQYMDGGRSWMNHRVDPDGREEMIHSTQLDSRTVHIIRTVKLLVSGKWAVWLNSVIVDQDDGSQKEHRLDQPWTSEGIEAYCGLTRTNNAGEDQKPDKQVG